MVKRNAALAGVAGLPAWMAPTHPVVGSHCGVGSSCAGGGRLVPHSHRVRAGRAQQATLRLVGKVLTHGFGWENPCLSGLALAPG